MSVLVCSTKFERSASSIACVISWQTMSCDSAV